MVLTIEHCETDLAKVAGADLWISPLRSLGHLDCFDPRQKRCLEWAYEFQLPTYKFRLKAWSKYFYLILALTSWTNRVKLFSLSLTSTMPSLRYITNSWLGLWNFKERSAYSHMLVCVVNLNRVKLDFISIQSHELQLLRPNLGLV